MTTAIDTAKYTFTGPNQWELYSREVKQRAIDADLWQYIDADQYECAPR